MRKTNHKYKAKSLTSKKNGTRPRVRYNYLINEANKSRSLINLLVSLTMVYLVQVEIRVGGSVLFLGSSRKFSAKNLLNKMSQDRNIIYKKAFLKLVF